jgi:hypothetical protein
MQKKVTQFLIHVHWGGGLTPKSGPPPKKFGEIVHQKCIKNGLLPPQIFFWGGSAQPLF